MRETDDLRELPIVRELGVSIRAAAAAEDDRMHRLVLHRARRRRRLALSTAGLAGIAATAAIAISSGLGPGDPTEATAATVLTKTAAVAAREADQVPTPTQFFYVRSTSKGAIRPATVEAAAGGERPIPTVSTREIWTSIERPGRLLTTPLEGTAGTPTPGNGRVGNIGPRGRYQLGSLELTRHELDAFPTDPATLYERLQAGVAGRGTTPEAQIFDDIAVALGEQPIPSRLRAALYRTLARIPGVALASADSPETTTVTLTTGGVRHELTFDARTAVLSAVRDVVDGETVAETRYEARAVTDTTTKP